MIHSPLYPSDSTLNPLRNMHLNEVKYGIYQLHYGPEGAVAALRFWIRARNAERPSAAKESANHMAGKDGSAGSAGRRVTTR
jgi:hypothetical protein